MFLSFFKKVGNSDSQFVSFYRNPNVVSCVFRALDDLSQALILRLMRERYSISEEYFQFMITESKQSKEKLLASLNLLKTLSIFQNQQNNSRTKSLCLNQKFRHSLEKYIATPEDNIWVPLPKQIEQQQPLPLYNFLYEAKSEIVTKVLRESKLFDGGITKDGFSFVLEDISTQVCILLKGYTQYRRKLELWESILEISNLDLGKAYKIKNNWSDELLSDLRSFKFITSFMLERDQYICVNKLFKNFSFQQPNLDLSLKCDIIVETNFKIYTHVKSLTDRTNYQVLKKILGMFVQLDFPNLGFQQLIVGTLVKPKVMQAYDRGLTSDHILKFFRKHTDLSRIQQTKKKTQIVSNKNDQLYNEKKNKLKFLKIYNKDESDILPNNVIQQLKLWQNKDYKMDDDDELSEISD